MIKLKNILALSAALLVATSANADTFVGKDNCNYRDRSLTRRIVSNELVFVIDQSESLTISHKKQAIDLVNEILVDDSIAPVGTHISIFVFGKNDFKPDGSGQNIDSVLSVCKPQNTANSLYQNTRKINHQFESKYLKPIQGAIDQAASGALGERSPILEMIQYISSHTYFNHSATGSKRMILVSDLLQHSETYSSYSNKSFTVPAALQASLKGWDISVLAPKRYGTDKEIQNGGNLKMWNSFFKTAEASSVNIKFLP